MDKHVLLIDDDPIFHVIFIRMIQKICTQLKVTSLLDGKMALDHLKKNYTSNNQYIIFLDINMPVINGWQFLNEIKKSGIIKNNNLTLYIVSSSTDTDDIMQAQSHDLVKNIFSKPLSINSVKHILQS
jgi:CheY-like chemotaxis protein